MKKIVCDNCGSENAKSYSQVFPPKPSSIKDLCVNCLQDFVLKNQVKLTEVSDDNRSGGKRVLHG